MFGPAHLPADITNKLNAAIVAAMTNSGMREQLQNEGVMPVGNSTAEFKLNLASGLFRERAAGRLALALRRLVGRHIGLSLGFVPFGFLFFLFSLLPF